ncbi:MAG: alpha/beta hydrolase [Hyphomicrobiales bacterium]|nr:alpha/beta hydrolase [Hyphomicrobiales bacterium]
MPRGTRLKQAVVVVHGMGEQRPLDMLNRFIDAAIPGTTALDPDNDLPVYYSRPTLYSDSYESRSYLARQTSDYLQTEFYEYHWSHMMQGNKISDIWDTFQRILFTPVWRVPNGLRVVWVAFWALIFWILWLIAGGKIGLENLNASTLVSMIVGGGTFAGLMSWALTKFLPGKITASFVDVVRYLDTSPRSYAVRKNIRKGMVDFLENLHKDKRYDRIIVVAHSLGAFIAYDGISYLWTRMNQDHVLSSPDEEMDECKKNLDKKIVKALEDEAQLLLGDPERDPSKYQKLQRELWNAYREVGNPWLITDFVTAGTPMYMADKLLTNTEDEFRIRQERRDIASCPPLADLPGRKKKTFYSYRHKGGDVLYHAAPFAVVRWSNMWFPAHLGFFGDWFGGPLRRLFGAGIKDHALDKNDWKRFLPAWAHTLYFTYPDDEEAGSATKILHNFMELKPDGWLKKRKN